MSSPVESTTDSQIKAHRPIGQFIMLRAWPDYFLDWAGTVRLNASLAHYE
jgi:hypothetical protein